MILDYHASCYAHKMSRVGGTNVDRLGHALFDAGVDLNPHQLKVALFALRSRLLKGVMLDDEVGLGKTIEAGRVWLDILGDDLIEELFENKEDGLELQINTDEHRNNDSNIDVYPCSSVVQIEKVCAEFDTKTKKGMRSKTLEWPPESRNRQDRFVDLHGLVPYWIPHEWRVA